MGTGQGCQLSPLLFVLYLNTVVISSQETECSGVYLNEDFPNVYMLLYADDMADIADTVGRLQYQINVLSHFCDQWGFTINTDKTKVMVFRNGGPLRRNEKFYYKGTILDVVSFYKYLGSVFTSRLCWTATQKTLAVQAQKAVGVIKHIANQCGGLTPDTYFKLFDSMVLPTLLYSSEIWGHKVHQCIELVQIKFCKYVLKVAQCTPNAAVMGECGRLPVAYHSKVRMINYWLKILSMPNSRLPRVSYTIMVELDLAGRVTWATHVKNILNKYGFSDVWTRQENLNAPLFLENFKLRVKDCAAQEWHAEVEANRRLGTYVRFKFDLNPELYLNCVVGKCFKSAMARFRCSSHSLEIEIGRRTKVEVDDRLCKLCLDNGKRCVENELHFLLICPSFKNLRLKFLPKMYYQNPCIEMLSILLSSKNITILNGLARYIYFAMRKRLELIAELKK